ncbi:putative sporulation protein YtxC [Niallia sp. XMNu-256]|uniref:putative sporulation protein YtxC n=1 Tax=Niallia sp. XMNu-256 TaxID=3082444 RepID=UPI0030CE69DA
MIEIQFQHKYDAKRLYTFLNQLLDMESSPSYMIQKEDTYAVRIECMVHDEKERFIKWVQESICQYILKIKLNDWFKEILSTNYHYRDEVEQQQIIDIIHSVLEGKNEELAVFLPKFGIKDYIMDQMGQWLQEHKIFSFDSFMTFRLRTLLNELRKYVDLSLDEYRMEQEYQMFIQMLRDFLIGREPKMERLHLLFEDEKITFFDEDFMEIRRSELAKMVDRKLLINHPIYIDSNTIAPLLSIAPKKIFLYSSDHDQPIIRTVRNIFEERLRVENTCTFEEIKHSLNNKKYNTP